MSGRFVFRSGGQVIDFANDEKVMRKLVRTYKRRGVAVDVEDRWGIPFTDTRTRAERVADAVKGLFAGTMFVLLCAVTLVAAVAVFAAVPDCIFGVFGHTVCAP